jgi:hypothetical protein
MKTTISTIICCLLINLAFAQVTTNPIQKTAVQIDQATLLKNQQIALDKFTVEMNTTLKQIQDANVKAAAELRTTMHSNISSYISGTLATKTIDKITPIDPKQPIITEVYCPNPKGIQPLGEFLIIGSNLLPKESTPYPTKVILKFGQTLIDCVTLPGMSTSERLWVYSKDFSGIITSTPATVTVTNNNLTSAPAGVTLFPEIVTQTLDLTNFLNQLKTDMRSSLPMTYVNNVAEGGSHIFTILYKNVLWVMHNCPNTSNRTTEYRGNEEFFLTTQLKNNWKVKKYVYKDNRSVCGTLPENQQSSTFGDSVGLHIKLFWFNYMDLCFQSSYTVSYIVEGPKGTNYW